MLIDPRRRARPHVRAGDSARDRRDYPAAAAAYAQAVAVHPAATGLWVQLGHMRKDSGDHPGAEAAYAQALAQVPGDADVWLNVGHLLKLAGRPQDAAGAYAHALELQPGLSAARVELAALTALGVDAGARPVLRAAAPVRRAPGVMPDLLRASGLRRGPKPASLRLSREGDAARDRRDWPAAARAYAEALKIDPSRTGIWVQRGHAAKEAGDFAGAEAAYEEALRREPANGDTHLNLGHLRKLQGRPQQAYAAYKRAVELEPEREDWVRELVAASRLVTGDAQAAPEAADPVLAFMREVAAGVSAATAVHALPPAQAARVAELLEPVAPIFAVPAPAPTGATDAEAAETLVFDVTDLMSFFRHSRLPTGIQRVQIETVSAVLREPPARVVVRVCAFSEGAGAWSELAAAAFLDVARLASASEDAAALDWRLAVGRLELALQAAGPFVFPRGATLVNLGASWEQGNYFLALRAAKARSAVRYVPFLHDLIPVYAPGFHVEDLTRDFIGWLGQLLHHADAFLANSEHTLGDLRDAARRLGAPIPDALTEAVPLDARMGSEVDDPSIDEEVLRKYGLERGRFVLFVSTIEPRKNHLTAFGAWAQMAQARGAATPKLVCVGRRGWLNEAVIGRLEGDPKLRDLVKVISGVPDHALATLYKACAFTLYPSAYEGWGLPVTESLCYGKVPLTSDTPSLMEAGGPFADRFEAGSERRLAAAAERLYFDETHRRAREAAIAERFRPRRWSELGAQIAGAVGRWRREAAGPVKGAAPFPLALGRYQPLSRNRLTELGPQVESGESFRRGDGWNGPEWWGAWTRPGPALLAFSLPPGAGPLRLYLGLRGPPEGSARYTLAAGGERVAEGRLEGERVEWVCRTLPPSATAGGETVISLTSDASWPLGGREEARTGAVGVVGFMLCEEGDVLARSAFVEEHLTDRLRLLA